MTTHRAARWSTWRALSMAGVLSLALGPGVDSVSGLTLGAMGPPAWGFDGHRVVCEIAWREMSPAARAEVRRLTRSHDEFATFADSCVWADFGEAKAIHNAHWVNLPPGSAAVTMVHCPQDCLLRHLDTELSVLGDSGAGDPRRAVALMFVAHFVGDLHAPLHIAYGSDRGGNGHEIVGLGPDVDDLHAVWDRVVIQDRATDWREYGAALQGDVSPIDRTLWRDGDALGWANESFRIVEDHVYEGLTGAGRSRLGPGYVQENLRTAESQLKKAGVRLAFLLERALAGT